MDWNSNESKLRSTIHFFDIIRMHWDFGKKPIVNSSSDKNIDTTYSWFDGRIVNFTKEEAVKKREMFPSSSIQNINKSFEYIESLSRAESNINPIQTNSEVHSYLNLPKIKSGTCMDQFGSLYEFEHKDDFYESASITHISCSFQSPLHKYDGDSFLEENVLRRIPPIVIEGKEFFEIKSLPDKQKKLFQSQYGEKFYGVKLIRYDDYTSWHYYWYQDERKLIRNERYKRLGI